MHRHTLTAAAAIMLTLSIGSHSSHAQNNEDVNPMVKMSTNYGDIVIELYEDDAPKTVANFLQYVENDFYEQTIFHRVIPGFVLQGGGFTEDMIRKETRDPIENEADNELKNLRGTLSMARTSDINSATSQFFINLRDNPPLDHGAQGFGYAVFGKVVDGMDVVDDIAQVKTGRRGMYDDVPAKPVIIESVTKMQAN